MYKFKFTKEGFGEIQIGDFKESFQSDHSFWTKQQYEAQWHSADCMLKNGKVACFATSISDPDNANFFRTWVCYPIAGELVFQEHILFTSELELPIDIGNLHQYVHPYESTTEDGDRLSEWRISA